MDAAYAKYVDSRIKGIAAHITFTNSDINHGESAAPADKSSFMKQIEKNPDDFGSNLQMGRLLQKEGANAEAEVHLKKAQKAFPQYAEEGNPYEILGRMYLEQKRDDEALAQFKAWSQVNGEANEPLLKAAEIYWNRKEWSSAADMLHLSIFINPYDQDVQKKLGDASMESGRWLLAIAAYRTLVGLNPKIAADAHYDLARAFLAAGKKQEAKKEVLRSLESAPTYRKSLELLLQLSGAHDEN